MSEPLIVHHDAARQCFSVSLQGEEACLMYCLNGTAVDLYRTYVPDAFRGWGIAEQLCRAAFEYAKAKALTVIPSCSYISGAYLKRHPEYISLVQESGD